MKKVRCLMVSLLILFGLSVNIFGTEVVSNGTDWVSRITAVEGIVGIDNSDKTISERIAALESELGLKAGTKSLADQLLEIENEVGLISLETKESADDGIETNSSEENNNIEEIKPVNKTGNGKNSISTKTGEILYSSDAFNIAFSGYGKDVFEDLTVKLESTNSTNQTVSFWAPDFCINGYSLGGRYFGEVLPGSKVMEEANIPKWCLQALGTENIEEISMDLQISDINGGLIQTTNLLYIYPEQQGGREQEDLLNAPFIYEDSSLKITYLGTGVDQWDQPGIFMCIYNKSSQEKMMAIETASIDGTSEDLIFDDGLLTVRPGQKRIVCLGSLYSNSDSYDGKEISFILDIDGHYTNVIQLDTADYDEQLSMFRQAT